MFRGVFEYRVVTQSGERLNLQPVRVSLGMPDLQRVYVRPGVPGVKAMHTLGSRVLVGFVDQDEGNPAVLAFEDAEGSGFIPLSLSLAGGGPAIGRVGDAVQGDAQFHRLPLRIIAPCRHGRRRVLGRRARSHVVGTITAGSPKVTSG